MAEESTEYREASEVRETDTSIARYEGTGVTYESLWPQTSTRTDADRYQGGGDAIGWDVCRSTLFGGVREVGERERERGRGVRDGGV